MQAGASTRRLFKQKVKSLTSVLWPGAASTPQYQGSPLWQKQPHSRTKGEFQKEVKEATSRWAVLNSAVFRECSQKFELVQNQPLAKNGSLNIPNLTVFRRLSAKAFQEIVIYNKRNPRIHSQPSVIDGDYLMRALQS